MQLKGYRAFLLGTATDLPTKGFYLRSPKDAAVLFDGIRKWGKVISSAEH